MKTVIIMKIYEAKSRATPKPAIIALERRQEDHLQPQAIIISLRPAWAKVT